MASPDTTRVYVIRSLFHAAIAIPDEHGTYVQWGFGDKEYMSRTGVSKAAQGFVLIPLGLFGPVTAGALERTCFLNSSESRSFLVKREKVDALRLRLQVNFFLGGKVEGHPELRTFHHRYSLWWYNCHDWLADQVRDLGAEVLNPRVLPRWGTWRIHADKTST